MTKREILKSVLEEKTPPYVPWSFKFTQEPMKQLQEYDGTEDLDIPLGNHILNLGNDYGFFDYLENNLYRDVFNVVWDRSVDKDIGDIQACILSEPTFEGYTFPDPHDARFYINPSFAHELLGINT